MHESGLDIQAILTLLERRRISYVLVGALGAVAHGARLRTADLDLCPATDHANLRRIAELLRDLDARLIREPTRGMAAIDLRDWTTLRLHDPGEHHLFRTRLGDIDVLPEPLGVGGWGHSTSYVQLSRHAVTITAWGLPVRVAALAEIVASKLAADRPQDRAARDELLRVAALLACDAHPGYGLEQFAADLRAERPDGSARL